jgi:UDP-GlcNAc:undecaprenyl-phosphate GlcNAc-1-phosphate transferase
MTTLFWILGGSWGLCFLLTPLARSLALRYGLVDNPDGRRKTHNGPIPRAGGLAILAATILTVGAAFLFPNPYSEFLYEQQHSLLGLLLAALVIAVVGVADDYGMLRGRHKLIGQIFAALIVIQFGLVVREIKLFGGVFELGPLAVPFTCLWLLGAINSLNLIDGMDGLLGCVGLILCGALAAMAMLLGYPAEACVAMAVAGALLGFLRYNLPPASIFLGDAGSMLIGLVVGTLAIRASLKGPATAAMAAPTALLAIPFLDTAAAIIRRKLTGRSIYTVDRGHLHHCLLVKGLSNRYVLAVVAVCCLLTVSGALVGVALDSEVVALVTAACVIGMLVVTQLFGHAEYLLVRNRLSSLARSLLRVPTTGEAHKTEDRIQGNLDWPELWNDLISRSPWLNIKVLRLNVNAPALHEVYHAHWKCAHEEFEDNRLWRAEIPLTAHGIVVGRLEMLGQSDDEPAWKKVACVMELVEDFEKAARDLIGPPVTRGPLMMKPVVAESGVSSAL